MRKLRLRGGVPSPDSQSTAECEPRRGTTEPGMTVTVTRLAPLLTVCPAPSNALIYPTLPLSSPGRDYGYHHPTTVQLPSCVRLLATLWTAAHQASLSHTTSRSMPKFKSTELVMTFNHLILCCPPLLPPSIFPCIRESWFSNELVHHIR